VKSLIFVDFLFTICPRIHKFNGILIILE